MAKSGRPDNSADQMSFLQELVSAVKPIKVRGALPKSTELGSNGKLDHQYPDGSKTTLEERTQMRQNPNVTAAANENSWNWTK